MARSFSLTSLRATAPETEAHLELRRMAVDAARANGWEAATEVAGASPSGEPWKADVIAQKGAQKVAVEIQWSRQMDDETLRRQERYAQSGVRCLWLLRQPGFPVTRDLPAVCIGGSLRLGFNALIPSHPGLSASDRGNPDCWHQIVPMPELLDAAFSRRFRFGAPLGFDATVFIRCGHIECWRESCRARTRIITGIDVFFGPNQCTFSLPELGEHPELLDIVRRRLPGNLGLGAIKRRFSKTLERSYVSNGCVRCDSLIGAHFEHDACDAQKPVCVFHIQISEQWQYAIERHPAHEKTWGVYPPADQQA